MQSLFAPLRRTRTWEPVGLLARASSVVAASAAAATPPPPPLPPPPPPVGPVVSLRAFPRPDTAKNAPRRARRAGLIPGVVYGPGVAAEARVVVSADALRAELHRRRDAFLCTTVDLSLGDSTVVRVLPRDLQLHPFRPKVIACNWLALRPGRYPGVRLDVPLRPVNEERCPAYREGGWLLELVHKLPVFVFGDDVPPFFAMDLRGKRVGDKVMASEINLGDGVHLRTKLTHDFAVAKLVATRRADPVAAVAAAPEKKKAAAGGAAAAGAAKK